MNVGFLGFGAMGRALAEGLVHAGALQAAQVYACALNQEKLRAQFTSLGIGACASVQELVQKSEWIFLAVKPSQISTVLRDRQSFQGKVLISLAAGMSCAAYEALFAADPHQGIRHLSLLPNLPCQVARGVIIAEARHTLHHDEHAALLAVLRTVAQVEVVDTAYFAIAGVIAGCAPAFAAQFIEALADAGVRYGLARDQAYRLAAHMLEGTAALIQHSGVHPAQLKDRVCSPAGSTIRGVLALEEQGLRRAVIHAVRAALSSS